MVFQSIPVPGEYYQSEEEASKVLLRAETEYCLFVFEDHGWREWLWFPGIDSSDEFAHWWVSEATESLCGNFFPANSPALRGLRERLSCDIERLTLHIDSTHNTYLLLDSKYKASLIPRFAWAQAVPRDCGPTDISSDELLLRWWKSIELTRICEPDRYLRRFKTICAEINYMPEKFSLPPDVDALILRAPDGGYLDRNWTSLPELLPLPFFEVGTRFWDADGEPFWGARGQYISALSDKTVGDRYMQDKGRPLHEEEFLFLLSFYPNHMVRGLPRYTSNEGPLPDQLPPTYTYWLYDGCLAAISPQNFVRCWPHRGIINASDVRSKGTSLSEEEFRRHFPAYSRGA